MEQSGMSFIELKERIKKERDKMELGDCTLENLMRKIAKGCSKYIRKSDEKGFHLIRVYEGVCLIPVDQKNAFVAVYAGMKIIEEEEAARRLNERADAVLL